MSDSMTKVVEVKDLTRRFGRTVAVDNISFSVEKGEIFGIIGPNGAGKTTTLRMLLGLLGPTAGEISIFGEKELKKVLDRVSYLPEERGLYENMDARGFVKYFTELYGRKFDEARFQKMLERLELASLEKIEGGPSKRYPVLYLLRKAFAKQQKKKTLGQFSKGMKQKVSFLRTLAVGADVLVLDEPTSGLDPRSTIIVREMIKEQRGERTVIVSTHIMPYAEAICDRVCILNRGKIVAMDRVDELKKMVSDEDIYLFTLDRADGLSGLKKYADAFTTEENTVRVTAKKGVSLSELIKFFISKKHEILAFRKVEPTLEDVFMKVTS